MAETKQPQTKAKPPEGENAGINPRAKSQSQQITDRLNKEKKDAS